MFDSNPAELDSFDNAIRQWCIRTSMPLYHGGNVIGDSESDYEYVSRDHSEGVSNYILGKRMVAAISSRKNEEMESPPKDGVPVGVVEVSLRDLLKKKFSADVDARAAELELERFLWKPFEHNGMNVTVVRGHIERLMKRAGKIGSFQKVRCIHNCLPQKFRDKVEMAETEKKLWKKITRAYVTMEVDQVDRKEWEVKANTPTANPAQQQQAIATSKPTTTRDTNQAGGGKELRQATLTEFVSQQKSCYQCGEKGHIARFCTKAPKPSVQTAFVAAEDRNKKMCFYNIPTIGLQDFREPGKGMFSDIDEKSVILDEVKAPISLPLYQALSQTYREGGVFEIDRIPEDLVGEAEGCLWSMSSTAKGQSLLTVWDTGAVVVVVPMTDGVSSAPIGHSPRFIFELGEIFFALKVYIVETANYQLLLGTSFMYKIVDPWGLRGYHSWKLARLQEEKVDVDAEFVLQDIKELKGKKLDLDGSILIVSAKIK
ncbi:hypothetical protein BGX38DRAFT_1268249 [Terfezia claveryi]|nr:hypothetical protein BGX38DRAFT_1268249 [Terfezia claveryi]